MWATRSTRRPKSLRARKLSPVRVTLNVMSDDDPGRLLTTGEVMDLFNIARSTVTLWRKEGKLRGYKPAGMKQWRWPSNQPAVQETCAALRIRL